MSTVIVRPGKKFTSANGNSYIKVNVGGTVKNVMLDSDTMTDWDNIKTVEIDMVDYAQQRNAEGELVDNPFSRPEVIDYQTFGRELQVKEHDIKLDGLTRKMLKETVLDTVDQALATAI